MTASERPKSALIFSGLAQLEQAHELVPGRVTAHKSFDTEGLRMRALAMAAGDTLPEHIAPVPLLVVMLQGSVRFDVEGVSHELTPGAMLFVDGNIPHAVTATKDSRLMLVLLTSA